MQMQDDQGRDREEYSVTKAEVQRSSDDRVRVRCHQGREHELRHCISHWSQHSIRFEVGRSSEGVRGGSRAIRSDESVPGGPGAEAGSLGDRGPAYSASRQPGGIRGSKGRSQCRASSEGARR